MHLRNFKQIGQALHLTAHLTEPMAHKTHATLFIDTNSWKLRVAQAEFYIITHLGLIYFTVAAKVSSAELAIFHSEQLSKCFSFTAGHFTATLLNCVAVLTSAIHQKTEGISKPVMQFEFVVEFGRLKMIGLNKKDTVIQTFLKCFLCALHYIEIGEQW
jgi:hypothetical protein